MFEIGWSELLVIGVVLIVVVGPKDLPRMLRTFGKVTGQMRRMAGDFRRQFDEALREAELDDVRKTVDEMRSLDPTKDIRSALNPIRAVGEEIRSSLAAATRAPEPTVPSSSAPAVAVPAPDLAATPGPVSSYTEALAAPPTEPIAPPVHVAEASAPNPAVMPPTTVAISAKVEDAAATGEAR